MLNSQDICALLASRICHDLINPVGAISNGVELLSMEPRLGQGAELALVRESVESASARIRFMRVAFGTARPGQYMAQSEIQSLLEDWLPHARLAVEWQAEGDYPRLDLRRALLGLMCLETALPNGGVLRVARLPEYWQISARAPKLRLEAGLWALVTRGVWEEPMELPPSRVQFLLLRADLGEAAAARLSEHADGLDLVLPARPDL